jgi:hypothetical protein
MTTQQSKETRIKQWVSFAVILLVIIISFALLAIHKSDSKTTSPAATPPHRTSTPSTQTAQEKAQQDVANASNGQLYPCINNPQDSCISTPSVDFYPGGSESSTNPNYKPGASDTLKDIAGRIASASGNSLILHTTSGRDFTINYPIDTITSFNTNRSANYGFTVSVGDELYVRYSEARDAHTPIIQMSQLQSSAIIMRGNPKASALTKY